MSTRIVIVTLLLEEKQLDHSRIQPMRAQQGSDHWLVTHRKCSLLALRMDSINLILADNAVAFYEPVRAMRKQIGDDSSNLVSL